jgi:tape measure domain-containing protein
MRLVTKDSQELVTVTKELVQVSAETRSSFESTANLYARVARSSRELGLSQRELIDFSRTVQQSIRISGSTAAEASAGVIQFGQALASSRLSGDELRSVLEQMPRLAQAIAEGMGVGIGTLRELGEQGELTAEAVLGALRKSAPEIAEEFKRLKPLASEALVVLRSSLMSTVGALDAASGVSEGFADAILDAAEQVRLFGDALTMNLDIKSVQNLGIVAQTTAATIFLLAFSIRSLKQALDLGIGLPIDALQNVLSRMGEQFSQNSRFGMGPGEFAEAFRLAYGDTVSETADNWEEQIGDMTDTIELFANRMKNLFTGGAVFKASDLDAIFGDPIDDIGRKAREAMARAGRNLQNMNMALDQQVTAATIAKQSGQEYADVLKLVKIRALGAASGQEELAKQTALLFMRFTRLQNGISDQAVVDAIREELRLIGMTNKARFVYLELQKLSADASVDQIDAVQLAAERLFDMQERLKGEMKFMENIAKKAAENILDAFADFLFDPFEDGVKGMLESFLTALRRMLANAVAFQILSGIPGIKGLLPTRAAGGPAFGPTLVGERGPEIVNMPSGSRVMNNSATKAALRDTSGMQFVTNIDARGADPGLIARLPGIMEDRDRRLMLAVQRYVTTGTLPI